MSPEENKQLLERYVAEVWDNGNLEALKDFLAPDYRRHVSPTLPPLDLDEQTQRLAGFRSAFPDIELTVEEVLAEGDRIAFRSTITGTHRGELAGLPPTGRQIAVGLVDVIRVEDGRFAEQWGGPNMADLFRQLGASYHLDD
ncbi:MAG TPA: ester cyclase [Acidimicrobiia bacterium]|nr:ester cyclase [Acidimicrobiia bacterium]